MLNFKLIISKILILFIFTLTMSSNVFGFDLKKLQAKQIKEGIPLKPEGSGKKGFTDEFLRSEAERMNLDVEGKPIDEIRKMVFTSRSIEKGKTQEEIRATNLAIVCLAFKLAQINKFGSKK